MLTLLWTVVDPRDLSYEGMLALVWVLAFSMCFAEAAAYSSCTWETSGSWYQCQAYLRQYKVELPGTFAVALAGIGLTS